MSAESSLTKFIPDEQSWSEIDVLLEQIADLCQREVDSKRFHAEVTRLVVATNLFDYCAIWTKNDRDHLQSRHEHGRPLATSDPVTACEDLVYESVKSGKVAPPFNASTDTEHRLVACPIRVDRQIHGVLVGSFRDGRDPKQQQRQRDLLEAVAELMTSFYQHELIERLRRVDRCWMQISQFSLKIHACSNGRQLAYIIANEAKGFVGCDRVSVLMKRGSHLRLESVSGVDQVNSRATSSVRIRKLAERVAACGEPLWYFESKSELPKQLEQTLVDYLDETHARTVAVLPVPDSSHLSEDSSGLPPVAVLVLEQLDSTAGGEFVNRAGSLVPVCSTAISNALRYARLPLAPSLERLSRARWYLFVKNLPATLIGLLLALAVVIALVAVPAEFDIRAAGQLQPLHRANVFAPADAIVDEVLVNHGQFVEVGQRLVELRKPDLDLEIRRVWGEIETARRRLASVQASRIEALRDGADSSPEFRHLASDEEQLKKQLISLQEQAEILGKQRDDLSIVSPMNGQVLTWDLAQRLESRPVPRGAELLRIANVKGPWIVELFLPDVRSSDLLAAQRNLGDGLSVSYTLGHDSRTVYKGRIERVAPSAHFSEQHGNAVRIRVEINSGDIKNRRAGGSVRGKIHCGTRSLGFVWLHGFWDTVRSWVLF